VTTTDPTRAAVDVTEQRRRDIIQGLRDAADWIEQEEVSVPRVYIGQHFTDRDAFDGAVAVWGLTNPTSSTAYLTASRMFGPYVTYTAQIELATVRLAELDDRERAVTEREAQVSADG
jgi:hypothetical protein